MVMLSPGTCCTLDSKPGPGSGPAFNIRGGMPYIVLSEHNPRTQLFTVNTAETDKQRASALLYVNNPFPRSTPSIYPALPYKRVRSRRFQLDSFESYMCKIYRRRPGMTDVARHRPPQQSSAFRIIREVANAACTSEVL